MKFNATKKTKLGYSLISLLAIITLSLFFSIDSIPQDIKYHLFADSQRYFNLPNTFNVISNIPFFLVGIFALWQLTTHDKNKLNIVVENYPAYFILFLGTMLIGIGSGYYHLNPNNNSLVWDRLPMTLSFMALYSIIIGEFISIKLGRILLLPLLFLGLASVLYWWYTETQGIGDLRFYAVVQFFPMLTIPIMLLCFSCSTIKPSRYWFLILCYFMAKLFEFYDQQIYDFLTIISGHSIKHLLPALGLCVLAKSYIKNASD